MNIKKGELLHANSYITEHFNRIISWVIGDIKKSCRMKENGTCDDNGALVGAFILWTCAIDYFGGLYTGFAKPGDTKARFKAFIEKYMPRYNAEKVEDLRWSLSHYYSPHHFLLVHENSLEKNKDRHLSQTNKGIILHLGWVVKDLDDAVKKYYEDLKGNDILKIKVWRYYKEQLPIMPIKVEDIQLTKTFTSLPSTIAMQSVPASGTVGPDEWFKK